MIFGKLESAVATFIPAPNCALVEVLGNQDGQICEWTFGAQFPTTPTFGDMGTLASAVDGWVNTDLLVYLGNNVEYVGVTVRGLSSEEDVEFNLTEPLEGLAEVPALPANCAAVMTKYTGVMGRSNRGRSYIWGIREDERADLRYFVSGFQPIMNGLFDDLLTAVGTAGWSAGVISYYHDHTPRVTAQFREITSWVMRDLRIDTQRRRLGAS